MNGDFVQLGLMLLGALALASGAWGVVRSGYTSARADDAEKRIAALRGEIQDKDRMQVEVNTRLVALTERVEALENENATLRSFVPTQDEMEEVKRLALRHYEESTQAWADWRTSTAWFRSHLEQLLVDLRRVVPGLGRDEG